MCVHLEGQARFQSLVCMSGCVPKHDVVSEDIKYWFQRVKYLGNFHGSWMRELCVIKLTNIMETYWETPLGMYRVESRWHNKRYSLHSGNNQRPTHKNRSKNVICPVLLLELKVFPYWKDYEHPLCFKFHLKSLMCKFVPFGPSLRCSIFGH